VLLGLLWWWGFRDNPRHHPLMTSEEATHIEAGRGADPPAQKPGELWWCVTTGRCWAIGMQYFLLVLIQSFFLTWLPTYLVQERHLSLGSMGILASLPALSLFLTAFFAGLLSDAVLNRTRSIWLARVPCAVAAFIVSAAGLILAAQTPSVPLMITLMCVSLFGTGLGQVSTWLSVQDLGQSSTGVVAGWTNFLGSAGSASGPLITAWLVGWTGSWSTSLLAIGLAGVCGAVLWLFIHPEQPLEVEARPAVVTP